MRNTKTQWGTIRKITHQYVVIVSLSQAHGQRDSKLERIVSDLSSFVAKKNGENSDIAAQKQTMFASESLSQGGSDTRDL